MKANKLQIAFVGSALVFAGTPAFANEISGTRITSERGITQSQWEATDLYKSHTCPDGAGKGMGVDMNFTADRSDDTWFAYCDKREIIAVIPTPVIDTTTAIITPVITPTVDTKTVSTPSTNSTNTNTITSTVETQTAQIDTQTAITQETKTVTTSSSTYNSVMVQEWYIEIKRLINQLLALIARLNK